MQDNKPNLGVITAIIIAIVVAFGGISIFAMNNNKPVAQPTKDLMPKTSDVMKKTEDATKMAADKMAMEKEAMMKKDAMSKSSDVMMKKEAGMYNPYSVTNLAQNSTGTNVVFFHAPWCPSCKSIDADITTNLAKLPEGFQILKADFDTSTALKQKYGVTSQSTFVKVDKDGNKIGEATKAFALTTLEDIVEFGNK
jgi:thiol-disulfide isomerase/thioredoxin